MTYSSTIVDVSHWQPPATLDWAAAVKAGCAGAIVKYTQGASGVDYAAVDHIANAWTAGVPLHGGYHFGDGSDPEAQAKHFLALAHGHWAKDNLAGVMLMLDAERNSPQMSVEQAEVFVSSIHDDVGRWPWLYMGKDGPTGDGQGLPSAILSNCPLLLPKYGPAPTAANLPPGFRFPKNAVERAGVIRAWQFTDGTIHGGPFPGLGRVDQSRLIGFTSLEEVRAQWAA